MCTWIYCEELQIRELVYANEPVFTVIFLGSDQPHLNPVIEKETEVMIKEYVYD